MWEAHIGIWRVINKLDFASHSRPRPSREWLAKLSAWLFRVCLFSFLYQYYINSHYPRNVSRTRSLYKKLSREKTLAKNLKVRDCLPMILYIISLKVSITPTSPSKYSWEVLNSNTYLTHSKCWEKFWCLWETLEEVIEWRMQFGGIVGSR